MKKLFFIASFLFIHFASVAQPPKFTHADTLRGSVTPERAWWDVLKYDISVKPDYNKHTIEGVNRITYFDNGGHTMQIDLQEPMILDSATSDGNSFSFRRNGNVYQIAIRDSARRYKIKPGPRDIHLYFHGKPKEAINPPWEGGWVWRKDRKGRPWISAACQGLGSSVWYPCKDYQGDEPDSGAVFSIIVPDTLTAVANGRLTATVNNNDGTKTFQWRVTSPINNYNIIPYIGKYVNFHEVYKGEKGPLDIDYWVLDYNLDSARKHIQPDVIRTIKAFEYWFGPFPFYKDGYKIVDAPYLGMEHQGAIAYGNHYRNGYAGSDLSETGWGMKWDFIVVHESGHEWFGNNITSIDIADTWIHESFTNYSETLFTEYFYGKKAAEEYVEGIRKLIANDRPIIGVYGVNNEGSTDMYYKGGNLIHTIRQVINNDVLFRNILRGLSKTYYHRVVTTKQIEDYINKKSGKNFSKVFDQYLRTKDVPVLEYKQDGYKLSYRWSNCIEGFNMPLRINFKGKRWIKPTENWQTLSLYPEGDNHFTVDKNFYINTKQITQ